MSSRTPFRLPTCLLLVSLLVLPSAAAAGPAIAPRFGPPVPWPQSGPPPGLVKVFLDCSTVYCDQNFIVSEIPFVSWVRDRKDAEVHLLMTSRTTGGGGTEYEIRFIGSGRFDKVDQRLLYVSASTDSSDARRRGMVRTLKLGLVRYASETVAGHDLEVSMRKANQPQGASKGARDPWNSWVFRTSLRTSANGEESQKYYSYSGSLSANRITERWKMTNYVSGNFSKSRYEFSEGDTFTSTSKSYSVSTLVVKSLGTHWGAGARVSLSSSTYSNSRLTSRLAPAIEYNLYPYSESTRRQLTFNYSLGMAHARYREETIFGKMSEDLLDQSLDISLDLKQPWGSTSTSIEAAHYLHDTSKNRVELYNSTDLRLVKGLSISAYGSISRIRDQLYLPKGEATPEEVLVRQRQLATSYRYYFSIGFTYSFGSIYNNVVNTRFQGSGR